MKKMVLAAIAAIALSLSVAVPALAATPSMEAAQLTPTLTTQAVSGGWSVNAKTGTYVTEAQKGLFKEATEGLTGVSYTPVFVMAKQLVAGTNYAYFCRATTMDAHMNASWKVVIVHKPFTGKASIAAINNFDHAKIKTLRNTPRSSNDAGAWANVKKEYKSKVLPKAARTTFAKAAKKYDRVQLTPLVLLSTQVVSGTNYRYLCSGTVPESKAVNYYAVDVYKNLKGNAEITSCKPVKMSAYLAV